MSAIGPKRTCRVALHMSAFRGKADIEWPLKFFQGPEDGRVLTFAETGPNPYVGMRDAKRKSRLARSCLSVFTRPSFHLCRTFAVRLAADLQSLI